MSIRALVADDDPVARVILARALPGWAIEPIVVADGAAAWEVISSANAPSLAIMDWEMPGLDAAFDAARVALQSLIPGP